MLPSFRTLHTLALVCFFAAAASAQVVTTDPPFPTVHQPITIIFNAQEGDGGLQGFTGDVYAHTGVITDQSTQPSDWRYVKTDWGENSPETALERVESDLYHLYIEDIRSYYGIPATEEVQQLAFVFRSADTQSTGRATGGADIFVDVYEAGLNVRFTEPVVSRLYPAIVSKGAEVEIMAVASPSQDIDLEHMTLFIDGIQTTQVESDTLIYVLPAENEGHFEVRVVVQDEAEETAEDTFVLVVNSDVTNAPRPEGIEDGITYDEDSETITLSLFAPDKEFVYAIGDFNDWSVDPEYFMNRDFAREDSVHWWITVSDLDPDVEYGFQYFIDGELRTGDLYAHKVLDPWNDPDIPPSVYPDLKAYPSGKTEGMVSVFRTGTRTYEWQATNYERPDPKDLVIYELLIRDFVEHSTYRTLIDTLDYLERLGVNAIELMPVAQFDGNDSWGYNPSYHLALDKSYGPADEFRRFIDECHQRGMAVILDVVYNHATNLSPLIQMYGTGPGNDFIGPGHAYNVFNHLNHDHPYVHYWLDRANKYWLTEFNVDGFRFDLTKGFMTGGSLDGYNAGRISNLKRMADQLRAVDPEAYIILEHFAANDEEIELASYGTDEGFNGMLLWGNMNYNYNEATMGYHQGGQSNFSRGYYKERGWEHPNLITYMESHDEQWLMFKNRQYGACSNFPSGGAGCSTDPGDYNVRNLDVALDRQKMAGAFFFTVPGPKMIWQFGELGYGGGSGECLRPGDGTLGDCPANTPGRTARKPVRWEYRDDPLRKKLYKAWAAMINLRSQHDVFRSPETEVQQNLNLRAKRIRLAHTEMNVVIVGNFDVTSASIAPEFHHTGTWYDFFTGRSFEIMDTTEELVLVPGMFHIFLSEPVDFPEEGLITVGLGDDVASELPAEITLSQNYPNPFNPATDITFTVDQTQHMRLVVYDLLGRRVTTLVDGVVAAGVHNISFAAGGLATGVYIYRLETHDGRIQSRQMVLYK